MDDKALAIFVLITEVLNISAFIALTYICARQELRLMELEEKKKRRIK